MKIGEIYNWSGQRTTIQGGIFQRTTHTWFVHRDFKTYIDEPLADWLLLFIAKPIQEFMAFAVLYEEATVED